MQKLILVPLCALAFGCTAPVAASAEPDAEAVAPSSAVVVVERTTFADASENGTRAAAVARFVRMRAPANGGGAGAVDEDALRLVGATVELPLLGECAATQASGPSPSTAVARPVELLDIGPLALEAGGARTSLQPRRLPDIVDLVSGVLYSTRASDADSLPARGTYVLRSTGSADVAAFTVTASAPGEPANLRVGDQDARALGGVTVDAGSPTILAWQASGGLGDLVYVDVSRAGTPQQTTRCLVPDNGTITLTASLLDGSDGTLVIHRLHRESFRVRGVDAGEIRFDFARSVNYSHR